MPSVRILSIKGENTQQIHISGRDKYILPARYFHLTVKKRAFSRSMPEFHLAVRDIKIRYTGKTLVEAWQGIWPLGWRHYGFDVKQPGVTIGPEMHADLLHTIDVSKLGQELTHKLVIGPCEKPNNFPAIRAGYTDAEIIIEARSSEGLSIFYRIKFEWRGRTLEVDGLTIKRLFGYDPEKHRVSDDEIEAARAILAKDNAVKNESGRSP